MKMLNRKICTYIIIFLIDNEIRELFLFILSIHSDINDI